MDPRGLAQSQNLTVGTKAIPCESRILAALTKVFGPGFYGEGVLSRSGFYGGAFNLAIEANRNALPVETFNRLAPGRYPLSPWRGWLTGCSASLHVPSGGENVPCVGPVPFSKTNVGGIRAASFEAHLDSYFPYHPVGFFAHIVRDLIFSKGRNPCP